MNEQHRPSLYTIPFGEDLCATTVAALLERSSSDPLALVQTLVFLPNNRAIRSLTEAFIRCAGPGLLLPRMVAIGDMALDEALGPVLDPFGTVDMVPAVIPPMQRLLLLAGLIRKHRMAKGYAINATEALRLARYLSEVIDELEIEEIRFSRFDAIKPEDDMAVHWQSSYAQLLEVIPEYEAELHAINLLGPAARRNILLSNLTRTLRNNPPPYMIVAAGISTAAPAIAVLLKQIALLPQSMVILPAVDLVMDDAHWDAIGPHAIHDEAFAQKPPHETHPQFHLKLLLDRMTCQRGEIAMLSSAHPHFSAHPHLSNTIRNIFCLADQTEGWRDLPGTEKNLPHVQVMTAQDSAEEARAIGVMVREALETPHLRIAVITPDRELAVRVAAQLKRWNIHVDDSGGAPLIQTPQGTLIMALAHGLADGFAPVSLLAIAKHPLVKFGEERLAWLKQVRVLDMILRGPNSGIGLSATSRRIVQWDAEQIKRGRSSDDAFGLWWGGFKSTLETLDSAANGNLTDFITALQSAAGLLTNDGLWKGANGRQLSKFISDLMQHNMAVLGDMHRPSLVPVLTELFGTQTVRLPYGGHPRVAIYGLLEARLQQADMLICAGLNEGTWPQLPKPDPWLAPRIRRQLGLAALERNVGLSAHDLASALGAKSVVLTRAMRDRGGPTIASRFLMRIRALTGDNLIEDSRACALARALETPAKSVKYSKPAPSPSAKQRMVQLSVTDFDRLKADPFAFYASKILRLKSLEPVDAEPGPAWRGTVVHDILEAWAKEDSLDPEKLMLRAHGLLDNPAIHPKLRVLWQPRIAEGLRWVAERTLELNEEGRTVLAAETSGHVHIGGVEIKGRADRIDTLAGGGLAIVDYKTGNPPKVKQVSAGYSLQLGLIGLIAESGGIKGVGGEAKAFEYWSLAKSNKGRFGNDSSPVVTKEREGRVLAADFVMFAHDQALDAITSLIIGSDPFVAKKHPEYAPYADYDQLMRFEEWNGREPIDSGESE